MPHFIVEYSANVAEHHDIDALLDVIHQATLDLEVAAVPGVRIRAVRHDQYRIADGSNSNHAFIAMVARIGPGRDVETKKRVIDTLLDAAESQIDAEDGPLIIAWSLEVQEIDANFRVNRNHIAADMKGAS